MRLYNYIFQNKKYFNSTFRENTGIQKLINKKVIFIKLKRFINKKKNTLFRISVIIRLASVGIICVEINSCKCSS